MRGGKFCMCEALRYPPTGWKTERPTVESMKRSLEVEVIEDFPLAKRAAARRLPRGELDLFNHRERRVDGYRDH